MSRVEVVFYSSFTKKGNYRRSGNDSCAVTTARHRLSLKGVLQLVLNRFALYRQSNVCFGLILRKVGRKNSLNGVIMKIVIYKNLKHNGKASEWPEGGV